MITTEAVMREKPQGVDPVMDDWDILMCDYLYCRESYTLV
ncbi:hypothetical protein VCHA54O485_190058 [Vibrio chagasii]|nr:hypothetical protein VCHA55P509_180058 [Vibrio chagasii]CAH7031036.1 hypothetical protein VCHA54O485_190058 [Vibrio chagasii]CAH7330443.1 hypothetical protein VCHA54P501_200054 [Vibrio chagasii]